VDRNFFRALQTKPGEFLRSGIFSNPLSDSKGLPVSKRISTYGHVFAREIWHFDAAGQFVWAIEIPKKEAPITEFFEEVAP
jgi:hypothetical protein